MWPFSTVKKDAQEDMMNRARSDVTDAQVRFNAMLEKMESARDEDVRAMINGLLPDYKKKGDRQ